ncbi:MAG: hypothetical protein O7G31_14800, partial [Calditrichaeota bacterium]|nr:hypothetical protein [Calditrichota bacterium]
QDRVRFLPLVNPSEVLGLISRFDFAVNMLTNPKNWVSYQHPAINKIYEYLGAGLPVLCSTLPAFERELVAPGVGVAVDATNPAAIKQGLQHILDNRAAISEMKTKALHLARTKYNWQSEEKILLKLYETLGRSRCFVPNSPAAIPS